LLLLLFVFGCDIGQTSSAPTSWATQLALAQQAARQIDERAFLEEVRAMAADPPTTKATPETLEVSFIFLRSSPEEGTGQQGWITEMLVSLEDTSPTSTLHTLHYYGEVSPGPTTEEREKLTEALASVQRSPAEALAVTLEEGRNYSEQHNVFVDPIIRLLLSGPVIDELKVPAVWDIVYPAGPTSFLRFDVDARTGQILKRKEK
jgi:hypothetical protein